MPLIESQSARISAVGLVALRLVGVTAQCRKYPERSEKHPVFLEIRSSIELLLNETLGTTFANIRTVETSQQLVEVHSRFDE
jgi:hypothetical protein